jgi:hypothetical protein
MAKKTTKTAKTARKHDVVPAAWRDGRRSTTAPWGTAPKVPKKTTKPTTSVWQQACDDIVASAVYHVVHRDAARLLFSREVLTRYTEINKSARTHEKAARSTVLACMELARKDFPDKTHGKGCRCRAYAILAINAQNACSDPEQAQALFLDARKRFDTYIAARN